MTFEIFREVIRDNIPEILCIGDYAGRIKKCIEILKNTHTNNDLLYIKQESDDIVKMLDIFLTADETEGYLRDHDMDLYHEASDIRKICKSCLYEERYWKKLPIDFVFSTSGEKMSILDLKIGDTTDKIVETLKRYDIEYKLHNEYKYYELYNKIACDNDVSFTLYIYYDSNRITQFYLDASRYRRWATLAQADKMFSGCRCILKEISKESIIQLYSTYYNVANVNYSSSETSIRITSYNQYEKENKPWWKK